MKSKNEEITIRILLLLKIDANNLFNRVKKRKSDYLEIFALRRTREHFPVIFNNRYSQTSIMDLSHCSTDLIDILNQFYTHAEELSWYMFKTEDMPNTVENYVERKIKVMEKLITNLNLFIDAELGIEAPPAMSEVAVPSFIDQLPSEEEPFPEAFNDDNSQDS